MLLKNLSINSLTRPPKRRRTKEFKGEISGKEVMEVIQRLRG